MTTGSGETGAADGCGWADRAGFGRGECVALGVPFESAATVAMLDATYPQLDAPGLSFVTLLNDFAVGEFETELRQRELLRRRKGRER